MTESRGIRVRRGTRPKWVAENQGRYVCHCGCGEPIPLRPEHYPSAPKFLHGHNGRVPEHSYRVPKPDPRPCECGCGRLAASGKRYVSGHNGRGQKRSAATRQKLAEQKMGEKNPMYGKTRKANPAWAGGRQRTRAGYVQVIELDHPYAASRGRIMEHRVVMERHLRATSPTHPALVFVDGQLVLSPDYHVHHINGVKDDNRIENLAVMTHEDHSAMHLAEHRAQGKVR